jgi:hypothetical protein
MCLHFVRPALTLVDMMTVTIYARVPQELKGATDEYAAERGLSLTSAVADLLGRGLEAAASEASIRALEARAQELAQAKIAADTMTERLKQVLGTCVCGKELTGRDLLVTGICPHCSHGVAGLLTGPEKTEEGKPGVNRSEVAPFMAGVGVALAILLIAYASSQ